MKSLTYYLATSVDGFLARENGAVDWLDPFQMTFNTPYDYVPFYKTVSTVIMGRKTWEVAKSFEPQPYADREVHVFSKSLSPDALPSYCHLQPKLESSFIESLKSKAQGRVWIVGGAQLASELLQRNLVDEIVQTIVPVTLGRGIHWLEPNEGNAQWNLSECYKCEKGVVQLVYKMKI